MLESAACSLFRFHFSTHFRLNLNGEAFNQDDVIKAAYILDKLAASLNSCACRPSAGLPYHSSQVYLHRVLTGQNASKTVAGVLEQIQGPGFDFEVKMRRL